MKLLNKKEKKEKVEVNPYLISKIQPMGGVYFDEKYIKKGDGYETCVHLYYYQTDVGPFWLEQLLSIEGTVATVDISTEDKRIALDKIDKSISENLTRLAEINNNIDKIEAAETVDQLTKLVREISTKDEMMKDVMIRYFVSAKTKESLDEKVKNLLETLEGVGYRGAIFLNEKEYECRDVVFRGCGIVAG